VTTILIIEDDEAVRRFLKTVLKGQGYSIVEAPTGAAGMDAMKRTQPDVVLLDLGLPDGDGIEVLRAMPPHRHIPVIVLSARGQEGDKVVALDSGADDYLTKPFGSSELLARIRVALRKHVQSELTTADVLQVGPIRIDQPRHEVTVEGRDVHLTPMEFKLLVEFARNPGRVLTHRHLLREVWESNAADQSHNLRVHVASLRRKLEADPAQPQWLVTEAGVGYRLRDGSGPKP
jgi:two-component system, OmpR family, KDP operon response regulator KdpE